MYQYTNETANTINGQKPNLIVDKTFQFSLDIIQYIKILESNRKFVIANQLLNLEHQLVQM